MLKIAGGIAVAVAFFIGTLWALDLLTPTVQPQKPIIAETPPLPPATRQSVIIAPAAISIPAIRDALDNAAPRSLSGRPENPIAKVLSKADIAYTLDRSPLTLTGRADGLTVNSNLNGTLRVTGQISDQLGGLGAAIAGIVNEKLGRAPRDGTGKESNGKTLDLQADLKGAVAVTSRPKITTGWRVEANMVGQVTLAEATLQLAGVKLNGAREVKSLVDRAMSDQMLALAARVREDPFIENAARREWAKLCRSTALGSPDAGAPNLWLEMRPTRAFAAQPRVDSYNVTITVGIQADTRIVPEETKPDCPFPAKLELVPPLDQGKIAIGMPIDLPFSELNRLLESQIKGKSFPDDAAAATQITVLSALAQPNGDRLLVSLLVKAKERKSWFSVGAEATIHVSGKPVLDQNQQILRLDDIQLAVESEAAFGLLGAAAKAAIPYLQASLAKNAVLDLRPALTNARKSIDKALADFRVQGEGVKADAQLTGLRLIGVEFDSKIVRVTAEADGVARVSVNKLPEKAGSAR